MFILLLALLQGHKAEGNQRRVMKKSAKRRRRRLLRRQRNRRANSGVKDTLAFLARQERSLRGKALARADRRSPD